LWSSLPLKSQELPAELSSLFNIRWGEKYRRDKSFIGWENFNYGQKDYIGLPYCEPEYPTRRIYIKSKNKSERIIYVYASPSIKESVTEYLVYGIFKIPINLKEQAIKQISQIRNDLLGRGFNDFQYKPKYRTWYSTKACRIDSLTIVSHYEKSYLPGHFDIIVQIIHDRYNSYEPKRNIMIWVGDKTSLPEIMIDSLEVSGVRNAIGVENWEKVIAMSSALDYNRYYETIDKNKLINPNELINIIIAVDQFSQEPLYIIFKNELGYFLATSLIYNRKDNWKPWLSEEQMSMLKRVGIMLNWVGEPSHSYWYIGTLIEDVAKNNKGSFWGDYAFLKTLQRLNDLRGLNQYNGDIAYDIGNQFLNDYPETPFYPDILFLMGKARETYYSAVKLKDVNEYFEDFNVDLSKAEKYRQEAIALYENLMSIDGGLKYEPHLKFVLPRLRLGLYTGSTYYYEIYD